MPKTVTIGDFLTEAEIERAQRLFQECQRTGAMFAGRCAREIIEPQMPRINAALEQENDAYYLAYCVELAIGQSIRAMQSHSRQRGKPRTG